MEHSRNDLVTIKILCTSINLTLIDRLLQPRPLYNIRSKRNEGKPGMLRIDFQLILSKLYTSAYLFHHKTTM